MKKRIKTLFAILVLPFFCIFTRCAKNDVVGHFTVKGYLYDKALDVPIPREACHVDYSENYLTSRKRAIEVGSGVTDSSGYFEFTVELRLANGAYRFRPVSVDLDDNEYRDKLKDGGVIDLGTLFY
jgi:hypothetical protein